MSSLVVVGIDSAELTGIAILRGRRIVRRGLCRITGGVDIERAADEIADFRPNLVAIEAPFVRVNPQTGLTLAELLGRWRQALERRWIETTTVLASTWQPEVLAGRITSRSGRDARKAAAREWARETFGVELSEDVADAAAIAFWAQQRARGREVPRRATASPSAAAEARPDANGSVTGDTEGTT